MAKFAVIDGNNQVANMVEADSLESAEEFFLSKFDVTAVVDPSDKENGDKAAIGAGWDGEKFIPLAGTELDEANPTSFGPAEDLEE